MRESMHYWLWACQSLRCLKKRLPCLADDLPLPGVGIHVKGIHRLLPDLVGQLYRRITVQI